MLGEQPAVVSVLMVGKLVLDEQPAVVSVLMVGKLALGEPPVELGEKPVVSDVSVGR